MPKFSLTYKILVKDRESTFAVRQAHIVFQHAAVENTKFESPYLVHRIRGRGLGNEHNKQNTGKDSLILL